MKTVKTRQEFINESNIINCDEYFKDKNDGRLVHYESSYYNRDYEEGWNWDNGFAYKSISTNTLSIDHEEDSLGKYNYFVRYEATSNNAANTRINFGTEAVTHGSKANVPGTVIELSVKADDVATLGTIAYLTTSVGRDTVKLIDESGKIVSTVPRSSVVRAQTPQVFSRALYKRALSECEYLGDITDDNMLVERLGAQIYAVDIGPTNVKITTRDDLTLAKNILTERGEGVVNGYRIGHGYDVHKLVEGRKLIIGGVEIPYERGLLGHSDADVLLHAIMDSLLGAAALGDIGRHFPDSSDEFRGISSMHLLTRVAELIRKNGFNVVNVDATLVMQRPKVAPYVPKMISNIAFALGIPEDAVNVKATTEEHLGFTGREEGASAHSVAMLVKN